MHGGKEGQREENGCKVIGWSEEVVELAICLVCLRKENKKG